MYQPSLLQSPPCPTYTSRVYLLLCSGQLCTTWIQQMSSMTFSNLDQIIFVLTVYKLHLDEYTSVANDIRTIAQHIINGLSPLATTALHAHAATHPDILRQPWQLWDYLFGIYGNYTEHQIQLIRDKLNSPIADTETLASHAVTFHQNISFLDRIHQSLSPVDQMAAYSRSLSSNTQYIQAITLYKSSQPLAECTLLQMTTFVEAQAPNMPIQSSNLGYSAAATTTSRSTQQQAPKHTLNSGHYGYGGITASSVDKCLKIPKPMSNTISRQLYTQQ